MWFPDVTVTKWFKIYPELKEQYPRICPCGEIREDVPFVSKDWVGLKYHSCKCGKLSSQVSIPRTEKLRKEFCTMLSKLY